MLKPGYEVDRLFLTAIKAGAANIHLKAGQPPVLRVNGELQPLQGAQPLTPDELVELCHPILDDRHLHEFTNDGGTDFAHVVKYENCNYRFRVNLFTQCGSMVLVAQAVEPRIPALAELNLPPVLEKLCRVDQGMILVAGMTGTGKTTTIASMLDWINHHYRKHILTIEDPVEYIFDDKHSLVNQREVGECVKDFSIAMKHAVREDPDIILVGEMRDAESFETALHAAETGHLVFGTVHASSAATVIGRILDLFPQAMHNALRSSMAFNVKAVIAQKLLSTVVEKPSRIPIAEVMLFNATVRKLVLQGEEERLQSAIGLGRPEGMQTFEDSLFSFVEKGYIGNVEALEAAPNPEAFKMRLKGIAVKSSGLL